MAKFSRQKKSRPIPKLEPRIAGLTALIMVVLGAATVRLYYLQIIKHHDMAELADRNRIRIQRLPAMRGLVFDSRHRALVDTRPSFDATITPEDSPNLQVTIARLERLLGEDNMAGKLSEAEDQGRPEFEPVTVEEGLSWQQMVALETHQLDLPGVSLQVQPRRHYIYGSLASHLLGYVGEVTVKDLTKYPDYRMSDQIGKFGLERSWEDILRGQAGGQEVEVDSVGRRLRMLREIPEQPGNSVVMTIDLDLQQVAERSFGEHAGALVALDPNTGYVLAMTSHPAFDPDIFAEGIKSAQWRTLTTDPSHPLEDRAIQGAYPAGSTFKVVDAIAGLEDRTLTTGTDYYCPGGLYFGRREYRCWRKQGHGHLSVHRAIVESCDVFFYQVGEHLGIDRLAQWAHALGLGKKTDIDLGNEKAGNVPSTEWKEQRFHERWYPAETLSVAIGQGYLTVTPIQLAELAAQVANGGIRYKPQFVRETRSLDGTVVKDYPPVIESRVRIDPSVLQTVRDAMADVVAAPNGTAHAARIDGITIAAKTGTAQVVKEAQGVRVKETAQPEKYRDHGWFIAYAPVDHPQIAIACIVEHGGHGASSAGLVVRAVLQRYFELHPPQNVPRSVLTDLDPNKPAHHDVGVVEE